MAVGVIDIAFLKDRRVNLDEENYVCYFGVGTIWGSGGPRNIGKEGYHEGDILEVMVDQKEGLIAWSVNGVNKTEKTLEILKDKTIQWFPFLMMRNTGDQV